MNRVLLWIAVALWLAATLMIYQSSQRPIVLGDPTELMKKIEAHEAAAGDDTDKLRKVIKEYQTFAKQFAKTEYAAKARLRIGIIEEEKLSEEGKQPYQAVNTYRLLVRDFSPKESPSAAEADRRLLRLERRIDRENSHNVLYKSLDRLVKLTGANPKYSYALALLVITFVFKLLTTPLTHLQFKYMKEMQRIQPLIKDLQEKYKDNQKELGVKIMALYKEHGVNPFASCLPLLVQIPVLYLLYWMVRLYQFQFAQGEFLWIGSRLAERWPKIIAPSLAQSDIPLLVLYTVSMFISQKLTVVDPTQAEQQKIMTYTMPLLFGFMFWKWAFPSAFMLYWLFFNVLATLQQYYVLKQPPGPDEHSGQKQEKPADTPDSSSSQPRRPAVSPGRKGRRKRRFAIQNTASGYLLTFPASKPKGLKGVVW